MAAPSKDAILASYAERRFPFNVDDRDDDLARKSGQARDPQRAARPSQHDLSGRCVVSSLTRAQYGRWRGTPACLIGLCFQFHGGDARLSPFRSAELLVECTTRPPGPPDADPRIVNYGPKFLRSSVADGPQGWNYQATLSAQASAGPVAIGPQAPAASLEQRPCHYASEVASADWKDDKHREPNCVRAWLNEDRKHESGRPLDFLVALVIQTSTPFKVTARVDVRTPAGEALTAMPWSKDAPALLQPDLEHGDVVRRLDARVDDFDRLKDDDWRKMVTPDLAFRRFIR